MHHVYILGYIETIHSKLFQILLNVEELERSHLKLQDRWYGQDIVYKSDTIDFFVYGNELDESEEKLFFDCEYKKSMCEAHAFVNTLMQVLKEANVPAFQFDYGQQDEDGNEIGEQFEVRSTT